MKFSKLRQLLLVSAIGLVVAALFSGCQLVTIDYLFVATGASSISGSSTTCPAGEIETFAVDSESGAIRTGQPQVCSGGTTPTFLAVSPGYQNLYVANKVDMNIVRFAIAANGVLTKKESVTLPRFRSHDREPRWQYALCRIRNHDGYSHRPIRSLPERSASLPNQVALTIPGYASDSVVPTGVTVLANGNAVYLTAYDLSSYNPGGVTTSTASPGWLFGFATGSGGALTPPQAAPTTPASNPQASSPTPPTGLSM